MLSRFFIVSGDGCGLLANLKQVGEAAQVVVGWDLRRSIEGDGAEAQLGGSLQFVPIVADKSGLFDGKMEFVQGSQIAGRSRFGLLQVAARNDAEKQTAQAHAFQSLADRCG